MVVDESGIGSTIDCVQCKQKIVVPSRPPPNPAQLEQFLKDAKSFQDDMLVQITKLLRAYDEAAIDRAELIALFHDHSVLTQKISKALTPPPPVNNQSTKPPRLIKFG